MRAALLAIVSACLVPGAAPAQPVEPPASPEKVERKADDRPYWHLPRKRDWGFHVDPPDEGEPDWNPLHPPARALEAALQQVGIRFDVDTALYYEHASDRIAGDRDLGTFAWQAVTDWNLLKQETLGTTYLQWTFLGSPGIGHEAHAQSLSGNVGSISGLNGNVFPDDAALDELYLKQVSAGGRLVLAAGHVDQSWYFDTNRVANDGYRQFSAFALENDLSIPFSTYGGVGALVRFEPHEDVHIMAAVSTRNEEPWAFWHSVDGNEWGQIFELRVARDLPFLGEGHYRVTPWHSHLSGQDGFGIGLNFDQELGLEWLVSFFRFGIGNEDVTSVERFLSGGFAVDRPFGRKGDRVSLGFAWSDPSPGAGARDETLLEIFYRLELSPSVALTPDLQIVLDPANNARNHSILVGSLRLEIRL